MNKTYTVKQVADILGYSTNSIYTFLKEGQIVGIRLGKGRYRVAQTELDKILHLKKSPEVPPVSTVMQKSIQMIEPNSIPSLFDWFVSLVSIVMGLTTVLFVRNFEDFSKVPLSELLSSMKINFLVAGIGLFSINLFYRVRRRAFFIFYFLIFVNCLVYSLFLFLGKDILGSLFFTLISVVIFFQTVYNQKRTMSFSIFVTMFTILSTVIMVLFPSMIDFFEISKTTGPEQNLVILLWSILVVIGGNLFIWFFKKEKKSVYWISFICISIGLGYFAYLYLIQLYWSRALIFILLILFLFILSFWDEISGNNQEIQRRATRIFVSIALIFLVGISFTWAIQKTIYSYAQKQLVNKLVYGRNLTESMISTSQNELEILSKNKLLIEAIKKDDVNVLYELAKNIFMYSSTFRRVLVANEKGDLLTNYPYTNVDYKNIAFRDYFKRVKEEKKSYLSNIFESSANGQKRYVVSINIPILDEENNFRGIIIGSFNIDSLANKLQQVANLKENEYFILIDEIGSSIISPKYIDKLSLVNVEKLAGSLSKGIIIEETPNLENKSLQIYDKVDDQKWTIAIRQPLINIYNIDKSTVVLLVISLIGFSLSIIYLSHLNR